MTHRGNRLCAAVLVAVAVAVSVVAVLTARPGDGVRVPACDWRAIDAGTSLPLACRDGNVLHLNGGQFTYDMRTGKLTDHR